MDIKSLEYFIAVAEQLNFSQAAKKLYISQPTLSLRISALEEELGVRLFTRTKRSVYMTEAGAALLPHVKEAMRQIDHIYTVAKSVSESVIDTGRLTIAFDETEDDYDRFHIYESIAEFKDHYPKIRVDIQQVKHSEYAQALLEGKIDIAMMVLQENDVLARELSAMQLVTEHMVIVTHVSNKCADMREALSACRLIMYDNRDSYWNKLYLEYFGSHGYTPEFEFITNDEEYHISFLSPHRAAIMPEAYARQYRKKFGSMFRFEPDINVVLSAVWNKELMNPAVQMLLNGIRENAREIDA